MSKTYWLIEAPGLRWLSFGGNGSWPHWTADATIALAFHSKSQAEEFLTWMRSADPQRYAFEANLGPAVVTEHMNVED